MQQHCWSDLDEVGSLKSSSQMRKSSLWRNISTNKIPGTMKFARRLLELNVLINRSTSWFGEVSRMRESSRFTSVTPVLKLMGLSTKGCWTVWLNLWVILCFVESHGSSNKTARRAIEPKIPKNSAKRICQVSYVPMIGSTVVQS